MNNIILVQERPRTPSQLVEVPVTANGLQRIPFPDVQQLRSYGNTKVIVSQMRLITAEVLTNGVINTGVNAPIAELQKITFVFYCDGWEKGQYIPALTFNDMVLPGGTFPHRYAAMNFENWENIDWSKSFLQYANSTSSANSPYVVLLDVIYTKLDAATGRPLPVGG